jgi:hypothetical protein
MEKEVAKRLANLKEYTAYCKLGTIEHPIQALEKRPADAPHIVHARREGIIEQTRIHYCKPRNEVEQEIAARQAELTKPDKKPPRSKQDD